MNRLLKRKSGERGSIAVEFAIVLPAILIPLLAAALFFGRFFWHYTVAEKAAYDAARFVAAASPTELKPVCPIAIYSDPCIVVVAISLARKEMAELSPSDDESNLPRVLVYCDDGGCPTRSSSPAPKTISVNIQMEVQDPFLAGFTAFFTGGNGPLSIPIQATARTYYVGN